ncbi:MAG: DNA-3-methyladenine glycosylase 2 family protein [Planctomycetota bacterium]|nr:MAG: DNA-3-methyladenine glycosylase 2 family protein [Planctomycetota bacterium]
MAATLLDPEFRQQGLRHLAARDPHLKELLKLAPSLRFERPRESLFTHLARVIIAQQVSVAAANAITSRVIQACRAYGSAMTASSLLAVPADELRACGLSRPKLRYLQDLAQGLSDGQHRLRSLGSLADEAICQRLCAIRGIGVWSSHMVLIFRFHRPDVLPTLDIGLRRWMERRYGLDPQAKQPDFDQQASTIAEVWRPYRSLATRLLWADGDGDITY